MKQMIPFDASLETGPGGAATVRIRSKAGIQLTLTLPPASDRANDEMRALAQSLPRILDAIILDAIGRNPDGGLVAIDLSHGGDR